MKVEISVINHGIVGVEYRRWVMGVIDARERIFIFLRFMAKRNL